MAALEVLGGVVAALGYMLGRLLQTLWRAVELPVLRGQAATVVHLLAGVPVAVFLIFCLARARDWQGLEGMDLAAQVSCTQTYTWKEGTWAWPDRHEAPPPRHHVVAVDYGAKRNILRSLAAAGCRVTVVPATASAEDILRHAPDGVFLSNGPGDPAATAAYAVPAIQGVLERGVPLFGICLGHQLLALALGGRTYKLDRGHRGANQPVKDLATGRVEITAQNHGFAVDAPIEGSTQAPSDAEHGTSFGRVEVSHVCLNDDVVEGLRCLDIPAFSVQYHPEAAAGPHDAAYLFDRFVEMMSDNQKVNA